MAATSVIRSLLLVLVLVESAAAAGSKVLDTSSNQPCSFRDSLMDPKYEVRHGQDVVWQIPQNPKAIFIVAHGNGQDALMFFDPAPNCEQCYGLPECRAVVLEALRRDYAVIVVKSIGDRYDSWWPLEASKDLVIVTEVIKEWVSEHEVLGGLPMVAWGHSGGTWLASALPTRLPLSALYLMCGAGLIEVEERWTNFPPTFFAYMPADGTTMADDLNAMKVLTEKGVKVGSTQVLPKPLSPLYFTEKIRCMRDEMSRGIFEALGGAGWLDNLGYMLKNPMSDDWRAVVMSANALEFCGQFGDLCLAEHVAQELKVAFGRHSTTSDANDVFFPWLESTIFPPESGDGKSIFLSNSTLSAEK